MHTTPRQLLALLIGCSLSVSVASAKVLQLSPSLSIDQIDADATFQALPDVGNEKYLCLWSGDTLQAFLLPTHEEFSQGWKAFLQHTEKLMKKEGAESIKIVEGAVIKGPEGAEAHRLDLTYKSQGNDVKQMYYVIKSATGYHSVMVILSVPSAHAGIGARTDKLMATLKVIQATK